MIASHHIMRLFQGAARIRADGKSETWHWTARSGVEHTSKAAESARDSKDGGFRKNYAYVFLNSFFIPIKLFHRAPPPGSQIVFLQNKPIFPATLARPRDPSYSRFWSPGGLAKFGFQASN
jgi:hypothetical protein